MLEIEMVRSQNVAMELFSVTMNRIRKIPDDENIRIYITPAAIRNLLEFEPKELLDSTLSFEEHYYVQGVHHIKLFGYLHIWYKAPAETSEWPLFSILGIGFGDEKKTFFGAKTLEKVLIFDLEA